MSEKTEKTGFSEKVKNVFKTSLKDFVSFFTAPLKTWGEMFKASSKELFTLKVLVFSALLLAMVTVLKAVGIGNDYVKLGLNAIPSNMAYYILGPVSGFFFGVAGDLMGVLVKGQSINPLITLVAGLTGFLSGLFLYGKPVRLWRVIAAVLVKTIVCSLLLNTLILIFMYDYDPATIFISRLTKNAIEAPVTIVVFYLIAKALEKAGLFKTLKSNGGQFTRSKKKAL